MTPSQLIFTTEVNQPISKLHGDKSFSTINALLTHSFHHAKCEGYMCDSSHLENDTTTCVKLHSFRGLYILRLGRGNWGVLEMGMSTIGANETLPTFGVFTSV
jgi:hypothetical protein